MQVVLTTITLHDVSIAKDSSARSLDTLSQEVKNLDKNIQSQIVDLRQSNETNGSHRYDGAVLAALEELQASVKLAALTITSASTNHHFDIPQSVSPIFTGRENRLQELREILISQQTTLRDRVQQRFIIYGLAGSGKTQFCCKFAQDNRDSFWGVFWIDASTPERAKQTLGAIAETAGLEKNEASALHWLSNLEQRWLLIIDNADDEDVPLDKYFPKGNRGSILVTTRNPAYKVYGNVEPNYYDFHGLELGEATQLLLKASDKPAPWSTTCEELALTITEALGFLALAIIHAGAAIRDKLCNLCDYLQYFRRSWQKIRNSKVQEKSSASEVTVYATWEICYGRLEQRGTEASRDALELLNVLAFLHRETISEDIFTRALRNSEQESQQGDDGSEQPLTPYSWYASWTQRFWEVPSIIVAFIFRHRSPPILPRILRDAQQDGSVDDAEDRVRYALRELVHMSLIIRNDHSDTYAMHPLVHMWARERPRMRLADQAFWADVTGRVLAASILLPPLGTAATDEDYHRSLLPHVEHVQACRRLIAQSMSSMSNKRDSINTATSWITRLMPDSTPDPDRIRMYAKFSLVYDKCAHWESAKELLEDVIDFLFRYLGRKHKRSRLAVLWLSGIHFHLGRPSEAAELQSSVLNICESHLGPSHPDTLAARDALGRTRFQQGQYTNARRLQERVLEELLQRLPRDDANVLKAMDNLGNTVCKFWRREHFEKALQLHSEAAEGMAKVHGADHEHTLIAKENLCRVSVLLGGRHLESIPAVMAEVLNTRRAKLGKEHPYTLLSSANMAIVLSATGQLDEAHELVCEALPAADRLLGRDHIGTLFGRYTLACILVQRGRYVEAEELLIYIADCQKRMASNRGDYHPDRLATLIELARCSFLLGKVRRAIDICDEAILGFDSISAEPHPLADGLRIARDRMAQLNQTSTGDPSLEHHHGITFPFTLFRTNDDTGLSQTV
ncbi:hypothetical protein M434DRAFT_80401 [Hypoxylon sp. CO27-5]|nr:hypothetical protein M434DRAFT_80401 [Hypoxylon sp. CO27-5]